MKVMLTFERTVVQAMTREVDVKDTASIKSLLECSSPSSVSEWHMIGTAVTEIRLRSFAVLDEQ